MNTALCLYLVSFCTNALPIADLEEKLQFTHGINYSLADEELENPRDATFDDKDRLYVLDSGAKCLFVWDAKGKFLRRIGNKGDGPGEFLFTDPARSKITFDGTHIIVLDDEVGKVQYFKDDQYLRLVRKPADLGRIVHFEALSNGKFLLRIQKYRNRNPISQVVIANQDFSIKKTLLEFPDNMFRLNDDGGWDYHAYSKRPVVFGDYYSPYLLVGHTHTSKYSVYNLDGKLIKVMETNLPRTEVTAQDRKAVRTLYPWLKPPNRAVFPDYRGTYNVLMPLGKNVILACHYEPYFGRYRGTACHLEGRCLANMAMNFGERGGLVASKNQILGFFNDENGDFRIRVLIPEVPGSF